MVLCKELPTIEITNQRITYMNTTNFQIPVAIFQFPISQPCGES